MKRAVIVIAVLILLGVGGCSSSSQTKSQKLGETVSTDIVDFTMSKAELTYYGNSSTDGDLFATPTDKKSGLFVAAKGHVLVAMTFTIKNNDRTNISVGDTHAGSYRLQFKVVYKGKTYNINGYDLNNNNGSEICNLQLTALKLNDGVFMVNQAYSNELVSSGDSLTVRMLGIASFEPDELSDSFEITVNVLNSSGNYEEFTYSVN